VARVVQVRAAAVPLHAPGRNAAVDFAGLSGCLVAVVSDERRGGRAVTGFGLGAIGRLAHLDAIRQRLAPRLVERPEALDPARARDLLTANEKPGAHAERSAAVAAIEIAAWDRAAKLAEVPAYTLVANRLGLPAPSPAVSVYAAGGYYGGTAPLADEVRSYLEAGYEHVKIKVGGASLAEDLRRVEAVLALLGGDGGRLAVDANGRLDPHASVAYAEALRPYGLRWFEEPGDPLDYGLQAELARRVDVPFATGESVCSRQELRNLVRYAGLDPARDFLQMDPGLAYGAAELAAMVADLRELGWAPERVLPHGGTLVGLHLAAALALGGCEAYPGAFSPFGGFGPRARVERGALTIPEAPGFGFEEKPELRPFLARLAPESA